MRTPICDFVENYCKKDIARLHMPGHKGMSFLGCERKDITEIEGADALYEAGLDGGFIPWNSGSPVPTYEMYKGIWNYGQ